MGQSNAGAESASRRELAIVLGMYWIYLHEAEQLVRKRFGEAGLAALSRSFCQFGRRRGQYIRDLPEVIASGRSLLSLLENWDIGDIAFAEGNGELAVTASVAHVELEFAEVPGRDFFEDKPGADILIQFWTQTLEGIRTGFDDSLVLRTHPATPSAGDAWGFSFAISGHLPMAATTQLPNRMANPAERIRLVRRTMGTLGILITSVGRELKRDFDGVGEAVFREIAYNFGASRGRVIREAHERAGKALDFKSFFDGIQERDRHETTFVYAADRHVSRGVTQLDCTYCPLAEAWAAEGHEGLDLAYQFDVDNHRGLVESYNPNALVRWDSVKSRGDTVCKFRFVIPDLVTDDDPEWAQAFRQKPKGSIGKEGG